MTSYVHIYIPKCIPDPDPNPNPIPNPNPN